MYKVGDLVWYTPNKKRQGPQKEKGVGMVTKIREGGPYMLPRYKVLWQKPENINRYYNSNFYTYELIKVDSDV